MDSYITILHNYSNQNLEQVLLRKENIDKLEEILDEKLKEYKSTSKNCKLFNYGKLINKKEKLNGVV